MDTEKTVDILNLVEQWGTIGTTLQERNALDIQQFKDVFNQTYDILKVCKESETIEKKYVKLILSAYNFIDTPCTPSDCLPQAAFVITERMLNYCVIDENCAGSNGVVMVYLLENYRDIRLDFNDVGASLDTLNRIFNKCYRNNIGY